MHLELPHRRQHAGPGTRAVAGSTVLTRHPAAVHRHRLRTVFDQMHRGELAVAPQRVCSSTMAFGSAMRRMFVAVERSKEHTSELQSLMRISYAVFCLKKKK